MDRREFLRLAGVGVIALGAGLAGGYALGSRQAQAAPAPAKKIKALWIYVGPITDVGWTAAHHEAKENLAKSFAWLEARHIEKVKEEEAKSIIEAELQRERYDAVFATSYGFKTAVKELAPKYPNTKFYHCSGEWEEFKDLPNVSTYFAEFYQLYYLNGITAGAVTETCKVGYVPAFLIPEVVRHINAFALGAVHGARLMGKCGNGEKLEVYSTRPLLSWFAPDKAKEFAAYLVDRYNVDSIAFTEDTTAVLDKAEELYERGRRVFSFSHYNDMFSYYRKKGRTLKSHLTGQVADWTPVYRDLLLKLYAGAYVKEDIWARMGDYAPVRWRAQESLAGRPEGSVYLAPLSEQIPSKAKAEIVRLYEMMKELLFEPFTGPIRGYKVDGEGRAQEAELREWEEQPEAGEGRALVHGLVP
ncbi:MAG: BMP family ABC transporter substrate-binding protein [Acidilobaceae archaeon]